MKFVTRGLAGVALLSSLAAADAASAPPYRVLGEAFFNLSPPAPPRIGLGDLGSIALGDPAFGALSTGAVGQPSPSVSANAAVGPGAIGSMFGRADTTLSYAFEVIGPDGGVPMLVGVAAFASAFATPGASFVVESRWAILDPTSGASLAGDDIRSGQSTGTFSRSLDRTLSLTLVANRVYTVSLFADAQAAASAIGSEATSTAFVDPIFSLDPTVDPRQYSFTISDGIGNMPAVPEPATALLLCLGLLWLSGAADVRGGAWTRRRRNASGQHSGAFRTESL